MVDGEKTEYIPIGQDGLIGIELSQGDHEIHFEYTPRGFYPGLAVSIVSIIIFVGICVKSKRSKKAKAAA